MFAGDYYAVMSLNFKETFVMIWLLNNYMNRSRQTKLHINILCVMMFTYTCHSG